MYKLCGKPFVMFLGRSFKSSSFWLWTLGPWWCNWYTCHRGGNFISRQYFDGLSNFQCNFSKSWIFSNCPEIKLPKFAHFGPAVSVAVSNLDDTPQITKLSPDHVTIFMISTRLPLFEFKYQTLYRLIQNNFKCYVQHLFEIFSIQNVEKKEVGETVVGDIIGSNHRKCARPNSTLLHFEIWTNTFCNSNKYISELEQIH